MSIQQLILLTLAGAFTLLGATQAEAAQLEQLTSQLRTGLAVEAGQLVDVNKQQNLTQYATKGNTVLRWQDFNVGRNEIVEFLQANKHDAVLNRVVGGKATQILGQLRSNGALFVVNPSGIAIGKSAQINAAEVVLSALDLSKQDFLAHKELGKDLKFTAKQQAAATVLNQGLISVSDSGIALIGGQVVNKGVLEARNGTVYLAAGHSIELKDLNNPQVSYLKNSPC